MLEIAEQTPASEEMLDWATRGSVLHVPALWVWEIVNAVSVTVRQRRITADHPKDFLAQLATLNFRIEPPPSPAKLLHLHASPIGTD